MTSPRSPHQQTFYICKCGSSLSFLVPLLLTLVALCLSSSVFVVPASATAVGVMPSGSFPSAAEVMYAQAGHIPHLPITVPTNTTEALYAGVREVVFKVLQQRQQNRLTLPIKQVTVNHLEDIRVERLTIATTNIGVKCTMRCDEVITEEEHERLLKERKHKGPREEGEEYLFVRVYGAKTDLMTNREKEHFFLQLAGEIDLGPHLLSTFENGYITEYVKGRCLEPNEIRDPFFYRRIAATFAKLHSEQAPPNWDSYRFRPNPQLTNQVVTTETSNTLTSPSTTTQQDSKSKKGIWVTFYDWMAVVQSIFSNNTQKMEELRKVQEEGQQLERLLESHNEKLVMCHNDLNHGNTFYNSERDRILFVDYETTDFGQKAFDLGNYFNEWAGLGLDFTHYPSDEDQQNFLRSYLSYFHGIIKNSINETELHQLKVDSNKFGLVSHLFWYVWAQIQSQISTNEHFDYASYGAKRLARYYETKDAILAMQ
jgi:thiamine kinase-like enzyme